MTEPAPPVNVRLTYDDGSVAAVQTVFTGYDHEGIAVWAIVDPPDRERITGLRIDTLPPDTAVTFIIASIEGDTS